MAIELIESLKEGVGVLKRYDDDAFDRLSNRYTVGFLVMCILFLGTQSYVGDPIDCYTPVEFEDNWIAYTDNYCWVKNTYHLPLSKDFGETPGITIPYYQWVPFILTFIIFVFSIPVGFWNLAMRTSGYDIGSIITTSRGAESIEPETRVETTKYIVEQLDRHITYHRSIARTGLLKYIPVGNKYGRYLFGMYVVTKVLYILAPIVVLFLLAGMMGKGYGDYGIRALNGIVLDSENYIANPMFPRTSLCDFNIRGMGAQTRKYTVQCLLSVNLFNERIFLIIWWWLLVLCAVSIIGLFVWLVTTLMRNSSRNFLMKYLVLLQAVDENLESDLEAVRFYTDTFLRLDGVFCMRLLAKNLPDVTTAEIIVQLYLRWKENHYDKAVAKSMTDPLISTLEEEDEETV